MADKSKPRPHGAQELSPPPGATLERSCVSTGPELCFDAIDNNCNGLLEEGCGLEGGTYLQFAAAWEEEDADVDLLVAGPSGEVARLGEVSASGLLLQQECPGKERQCRGQNIENVYLEAASEPVVGNYRVTIRLSKANGAPLPLKVRLGARIGSKVYGLSVTLSKEEEEKTLTFKL